MTEELMVDLYDPLSAEELLRCGDRTGIFLSLVLGFNIKIDHHFQEHLQHILVSKTWA